MGLIEAFAIAIGIWGAALSTLELRALATQVALPDRAVEEWDCIGTFRIEGETATTVKLYYSDSDSIAEKEKRRGRIGFRIYPNSFDIHAVYRAGDGPWKYKRLLGCARAGFGQVGEITPTAVTVEVRSKLIIFRESQIHFSAEEIDRIYKPTPLRLTLKDGEPTLK